MGVLRTRPTPGGGLDVRRWHGARCRRCRRATGAWHGAAHRNGPRAPCQLVPTTASPTESHRLRLPSRELDSAQSIQEVTQMKKTWILAILFVLLPGVAT